ncbi:MAG TPA: methyltransferase domain-containing protein [Acidimicrobiia bacterium]|nr:methyltransferase domain-containing protein [Acidimicrobiia bacterium]
MADATIGAGSVMHEHLLAVAVTEMLRGARSGPVSVLDAGCGDGTLVGLLQGQVPRLVPGVEIETHGFDVHDSDVQRPGFLNAAVQRLTTTVPEGSWIDRLHLISASDPWPFDADQFDIVVSNQVGEHVHNLDEFFAETARVLRPGGFAAHLFPLRDYAYEGHLLLPIVHWIADHDLRTAFIRGFSRMGLGKYKVHVASAAGEAPSVDEWAERHSDYIQFMTHYRTWPEIAAAAKRAGLRSSYRYTADLYVRKWASIRGRSHPLVLSPRAPWQEALWFRVVKRVSSITVFLQKESTYRKRPGLGLH